ncbi:MAG: M1 family aminopeptidase [Cellulomonadaceae bacterium]
MNHALPQARTRHRVLAVALAATLTAGLAVATPSQARADDAIDGAQTSGDVLFPNVGNGGYDALHYDIDLAWTPGATLAASTIEATSTMTATAPTPLRSFSLDFEGLEIDSVTVNGQPAAYVRDIDADATKYKLVITPAQPVSGEFVTEVTYHGVPSRHVDADGSYEGWNVTADGATFLGQPIGSMTGFPHNNTPADKATYTLSLDIPTQITNAAGTGNAAAVSIGKLVSSVPHADGTRRTWTWDQEVPTPSELVLISIGKYDMIEGQVTLSDGRVIPEWSFMDSALSTANKQNIINRRAQLGEIIRNLETIYGPYPGASTGVVVDTVPSGISYALETQDRSFFPSTNSVLGNTLIHELIHQWYGNNVAPTVWNDIWINEGMASWGPTHYNTLFGTSTTTTETNYYNSWNSRAASHPAWTIPPAGMTDSATLYDYQTYTRAAQMWEALKISIGDDAFFDFVVRWQSVYGGQSAGAAEFIALAEEVSGRDLEAFFQDWIYDADKPAWPEKLDLSLTSVPEDSAVEPGSSIGYTLTATNTGLIPLASSVATVDLSELLSHATLDESSLPEGLALEGTRLVWTVPETAVQESATVTFTLTVADDASDVQLTATSAVTTLGGTCVTCTVTHTVDPQPLAPVAVPTIDGVPTAGNTLTALTAGWAEDTEFAYQWLLDGTAVEGATSATFELPESAVGAVVSVEVTGSKPGYVAVTLTSEAVGPVAAAPVVPPTPTPVPTDPGTSPSPSPTLAGSGPGTPAPGTPAPSTTGGPRATAPGSTLPDTGPDSLTVAGLTALAVALMVLGTGAGLTVRRARNRV